MKYLVFLIGILSINISYANGSELDELVDIGGYKLHIHCIGTGSPAVILESGLGSPGFAWFSVFREIGKMTQVCIYDRAGLNKSDSSPLPPTNSNSTEELNTLLKKAKIPTPYLLVGHSFGGILVREYEHRYPQNVIGIVLVDSSHENQDEPYKAIGESLNKKIQTIVDRLEKNKPIPKRNFGILTESEVQQIQKYKDVSKESAFFEENLRQMANRKQIEKWPLGDKPLSVISAASTQSNPRESRLLPYLEKSETEQFIKVREAAIFHSEKCHQELVQLSRNSHHVVATKSEHFVQWFQPEIIVEEVTRLLREVRGYSPSKISELLRSNSIKSK